MKRHQKPASLGEILKDVVDQLGLREGIDEASVIEAWAELAGTEINAVTSGAWLERGKLYIKISNASWRQELHFKRSEWRSRLNDKLGRPVVKEIHFR